MNAFLEPGERIGLWIVEALIGTGATGAVYRVRRPGLRTQMAAKVLHVTSADGEPTRKRFLRESGLLARVRSERIVRCIEAFVDGERLVIISELVKGQPLDVWLETGGTGYRPASGPPALRTVHVLVRDIASGLAYLHAEGLLHRDLKPSNVIVEPGGRAKLVDFGLARLIGEETIVTAPGQIRATLRYTAPEVLLRRTPEATSDLYSLGLIIHEILTGAPAFTQRSLAAIASAQLSVVPPPPSSFRRGLPVWWDRITAKLLAKDPHERYASAASLLSDLRTLARPLITVARRARP